jgi:hypothetical protein
VYLLKWKIDLKLLHPVSDWAQLTIIRKGRVRLKKKKALNVHPQSQNTIGSSLQYLWVFLLPSGNKNKILFLKYVCLFLSHYFKCAIFSFGPIQM